MLAQSPLQFQFGIEDSWKINFRVEILMNEFQGKTWSLSEESRIFAEGLLFSRINRRGWAALGMAQCLRPA